MCCHIWNICTAKVLWQQENRKWLLLWKWESSHNMDQYTLRKWPTLGWSGLWIPFLLRIDLATWCDRPLVLQAAAPGHNWWYWSSYLWRRTGSFSWRYSSWTYWTLHPLKSPIMNYAAVWAQTVSYFLLTSLSSLGPARNVDWLHIVCVFPMQPRTFTLSGIL